MNADETVIKTRDTELMDEIREREQVYVTGVKYDVDGYTIGPDSDGDDELLVATLSRVFKNSVLRCRMDDCNGERIKIEDDRFAGGYRWECNNCPWVQEA